MKWILILSAIMALVASSAFAVGIDLTVGACGNNPGAASETSIDCASGGSVTLLGVFQPAEAYADSVNGYVLTTVNGYVYAYVQGDLSPGGTAAFWDWDTNDGCNPYALTTNHKAPAAPACDGYTNTFNVPNSNSGWAAERRNAFTLLVAFVCFRPATRPLVTAANEKLFGVQLTIDGATSLESGGGTCGGCPLGVTVVWAWCRPGVLNDQPTTELNSPWRLDSSRPDSLESGHTRSPSPGMTPRCSLRVSNPARRTHPRRL